MKKFGTFVSTHAMLLLLFGLGFLISPNRMLSIYNAQTDPIGELASTRCETISKLDDTPTTG